MKREQVLHGAILQEHLRSSRNLHAALQDTCGTSRNLHAALQDTCGTSRNLHAALQDTCGASRNLHAALQDTCGVSRNPHATVQEGCTEVAPTGAIKAAVNRSFANCRYIRLLQEGEGLRLDFRIKRV